ncbi:DUF4244 domain-containing protein [Curtobacterium sp. VKM Ac-2865]|uniref:DUF4244 domain-containing protein n=1 Tax=Curtobacterium sp. VKM Ac-2865 TaxID=2783817 RepID=UPI00188B6F96|nr:DUF4244 domain-containing protein [Curtobacterium sp. VKM Ac-2865]MBF4584155.1 DUF4244 domain-containing protein [Curtobacterium sp. VKM Ac-2865]
MTTSTPDTRPDPTSLRRPAFDDDRGSATAEYAVVILAAVAFAGVLVAVMRSGEVQAILTDLVRGALSL